MSSLSEDARAKILRILYRDRVKAHQYLFKHRRKQESPPFHNEMIAEWHDLSIPYLLQQAFRGAAKSTISEEAILIAAGFQEFKNLLIVGASSDMAEQRLAAIMYEIEHNEKLALIFGDLKGPVWGVDQCVLSTNIQLTARGRGQSLRGTKFLEQRPDLLLIDDLEERKHVNSEDARRETIRWLYQDLFPALDETSHRIRMDATPQHPESAPMELEKDREWTVRKYPILVINEQGEEVSAWPQRFPTEKVLLKRARYLRRGMSQEWNNEYMVRAEDVREKAFKREMFRTEPRVRTWQATFCMYDPARTVRQSSARTGFACWSWTGAQWIVWEAWQRLLMPSEIIASMFEVWETFHPVIMGFEEDGLNEWGLQPIRQEQMKRGIVLPVKAVRAPKGKNDFIRGMQPYFEAREVIFAKELEDLKGALLSFPSGPIDAPNALAYGPRLRPGAPVYEDFSDVNVVEELRPIYGRPMALALNATPSMVTGVLAQVEKGQLRVYADWVREGDPREVTPEIVSEAQAIAEQRPRCVAGAQHFNHHDNFGLRQSLARIPRDLHRGAPPETGRDQVRDLLRAGGGLPKLVVDPAARWVLNGFAGGFARHVRNGMLEDYPAEGPYRVLMEGLESFVGAYRLVSPEDSGDARNLRYDANGRPYLSILPARG